MNSTETLKIVVTGHVDHGKSTVIGRLLLDTGSLPPGALEKVRRIAKGTGKPFELAYLLDAFEEEQQQGITIDTTQLQFKSALRDYVIIDAPGHKEFLKNMISGAADAEAAFLVVDAARGVEEQSRRHAYMLSLLGIRTICVLINKMDLTGYSRSTFETVREDMAAFLGTLGLTAIEYIPLSALQGENILTRSSKMPWYAGHSLLEALDAIPASGDVTSEVLRFPIQDVYKFDDRRIIAGRIESGALKVGDEIVIQPGGKHTRVLSMPTWPEHSAKTSAGTGESVGITVTDEFFNKRGEVISLLHAAVPVARRFRASLFWLGRKELTPGRKYTLKLATQECEVKVQKVLRVVDASTLEAISDRTGGKMNEAHKAVRLNDVAEVWLESREPLALDTFAVCRGTGRFVLVDGFDVAGGGIVVEVDENSVQAEAEDCASFFMHEGLKVRCELFEEYVYDVTASDMSRRESDHSGVRGTVFRVGDAVPLKGEGFNYPEFFDVIALRDQAAVRIREGIVEEILPLEKYAYGGLPMLNNKGFAYRIRTTAQWKECLREHGVPDAGRNGRLSSKWLDFGTYRTIIFSGGDWVI